MAKTKQAVLPELVEVMGYDTACLPHKHERFCWEYIEDLNATKAYMRAFPGCSYETAMANSHKLRNTQEVSRRIDEILDEVNRGKKINIMEMMEVAAAIIKSDPKRLFNEYGQIRPVQEMDQNTRAAIASIEVSETITGSSEERSSGNGAMIRTAKIKMVDKLGALKLMGQWLRLEDNSQPKEIDLNGMSDEELRQRAEDLVRQIKG